jgi:hypothetical protein
MAKSLTAAAVKNYKPDEKRRREIHDGGCPGLYLVVQTTGHRSWALRFRRPSGKSAKLHLGPVDLSGSESENEPVIGQPLTLASARRLAADIHHRRAKGRDVVADIDTAKRRQKSEQETKRATTFAAAARDFIEQHAMKKTRRWHMTARLLGLDPRNNLAVISGGIAQRWSDKPVAEIDGHDVYAVVDETRSLGIPGRERRSEQPTVALARSMRSTLSRFFNWLMQHRRIEKNPCVNVYAPAVPMARDRVLSDAEIVKFWRATDTERFAALFRLLLLTGCRLNEGLACGAPNYPMIVRHGIFQVLERRTSERMWCRCHRWRGN